MPRLALRRASATHHPTVGLNREKKFCDFLWTKIAVQKCDFEDAKMNNFVARMQIAMLIEFNYCVNVKACEIHYFYSARQIGKVGKFEWPKSGKKL